MSRVADRRSSAVRTSSVSASSSRSVASRYLSIGARTALNGMLAFHRSTSWRMRLMLHSSAIACFTIRPRAIGSVTLKSSWGSSPQADLRRGCERRRPRLSHTGKETVSRGGGPAPHLGRLSSVARFTHFETRRAVATPRGRSHDHPVASGDGPAARRSFEHLPILEGALP
jgi:hypothetical protein